MSDFWRQLRTPIFGLAPMDGVTDASFRFICAKYGRPDVIFTEFTNVEGLSRNAEAMLDDFLYSEIERPVVAQIYGTELESFYIVAMMACALGFDGIDINMGCPAKKVASRGAGAGLIRTPDLAREIVAQVKRAVRDWCEGFELERLPLKLRMFKKIKKMNLDRIGLETVPRRAIPVSVKTRIGYDRVVIEEWMEHLLAAEPAAITLHGRTLKQMYQGEADWEAIARAARIARGSATRLLGNGDLRSPEEARRRIHESGVHGALVGRGAMGNPWIFSGALESEGATPTLSERFAVMLEHARHFEALKPRRFSAMRRHFASYIHSMPGAAQLRMRLFQTNAADEVETVLKNYELEYPNLAPTLCVGD